jgi:hypothetical protein
MKDMGTDGEFAEFDLTEDEIDAMMAAGQPVEVDVPAAQPSYVETLYVVVGSPLTLGGASVTPAVGTLAPSVEVTGPRSQSAAAA